MLFNSSMSASRTSRRAFAALLSLVDWRSDIRRMARLLGKHSSCTVIPRAIGREIIVSRERDFRARLDSVVMRPIAR